MTGPWALRFQDGYGLPVTEFVVRSATVSDADACLRIYRPYVVGSVVSFETDVPTPKKFADRVAAALRSHAWLVLERRGDVIGYAAAKDYDARQAYQWSCETGLYLDPAHHGLGGGKILYNALLDSLRGRGFHMAIARIAIPNQASIHLHESLDFRHVGTLRAIGWKEGNWIDVAIYQAAINDAATTTPLVIH